MAETKRCPHCGGSNPVDAQWCGQCLERFVPKPEPVAETAEPAPGELSPSVVGVLAAPAAAGADPADGSPPPVAPPAAAVGTTHGAFTVREQGIVWTCSRCDHENPLEIQVCEVCGTTFAEIVQPKPERPQRDPGTAAMVSLFFPGAGHAYLGLWGQAIARGVLSVWVVFVVLVALIEGGRGSVLIASVFGLAATGLWVVAAHDAYREARGEERQVILRGKVFLYLVLGLLVLLLVMLMISGMSARG